tara:strand:- start:202 stop:495 length:294 start_codon:yes stop_codon:yes gene_type:complete
MKITRSQLRRLIKEEISQMTGIPEGTPTVGIEIEWYPLPRDEESEGRIFIVPLNIAKQGDEAVRNYIDSTFYPRYRYLFSKGGADEIDRAVAGEYGK